MYEIPLDSKTVLLQSTTKDIIERTKGKRDGIDFRLYQIPGSSDKDTQTVMTFLASMQNPSRKERKSQADIDTLLSESLDKILIQDKVRSCSDYYRTNNKNLNDKKMRVG